MAAIAPTLVVRSGIVIALGVAATAFAVPPAHAGTCSSKTGGSNNQLIYTGSATNPYTCGYVASNGNNSIGAWTPETWTSSTAKGYTKRYNCQKQSGGVTVSYVYAGSDLGSSITYSAYNSEDGTRHWTGAVLWGTAGIASAQYNHGCSGYTIYANLMYIAKASLAGPSTTATGTQASYTVTVTHPDGGPAPSGSVALFKQVGASPNPAGKYCDGTPNAGVDPAIGNATLSNGTATVKTPVNLADGTYTLYAAYVGTPVTSSGLPSFCMTPPQAGLTGAQSNAVSLTVGSSGGASGSALTAVTRAGGDPQLVVRDVSVTAPEPLTVRCAPGQVPVQSQISSDDMVITPQATSTVKRGVRVATQSLPVGTAVDGQVVCRPAKAKPTTVGTIAYGSAKADSLRVKGAKGLAFGGLAADRLVVSGGAAYGGPGADRILIKGAGAGSGGPGADTLAAVRQGLSLLNGGTGPDRFYGSPRGTTLINARDGRGGDVVTCRSPRTFVKADRGDILSGSCKSPSAR